MPAHDTDFYGWSLDQARRLRGMSIPGLDIDFIAEELERLGVSDRRELLRCTEALVAQFLLPERAPDLVAAYRQAIRALLDESPSLQHAFPAMLAKACPNDCTWTAEQVLTEGWLPA